jgi:hypothetical protein
LVSDVKKAVLTLFLALIFILFLIIYSFRDYSIVKGCVVAGVNEPGMYDEEQKPFCNSPFIIKIQDLEAQKEKSFIKEIDGIKYFAALITPEMKGDDDVDQDGTVSPAAVDKPEGDDEQSVFPVCKECDFVIYFIQASPLEGFTLEAVDESAVNIQSKVQSSGVVITSGYNISKDKHIRESLSFINIEDNSAGAVITFSMTMYGEGGKVINLKKVSSFFR